MKNGARDGAEQPMTASDGPGLEPAELRRLLQAADPAALLVAPRLLRRVIKHDRQWPGLGLHVPHFRSYVIGREALLALATPDELGVEPGQELGPTLILIARPEPDKLRALPRGSALVTYWRLLFHARIHVAFTKRPGRHRLAEPVIWERIHCIGQTEFDEIRAVLRQEKYLLPPGDDGTVYEEFAAVYLELRFFAGALLSRYFSTIEDFGSIDKILAEDVDAQALFAVTRLAGAPDPVGAVEVPAQAEQSETGDAAACPAATPGQRHGDLLAWADKDEAAGNAVRAAIRRRRAGVAANLDSLVGRLQAALQLSETEAGAWRQALPGLLARAAQGFWPVEARLLYDLQKVCINHERPVYAPDLVEWAYSFFRQPLVRPLPNQPLVLAVKHLRHALARLPSVPIAEAEGQALGVLVHDALHQAEGRLRERLRPLLLDALQEVGLRPQNFPERISQGKLIEELLDRITERGFLNMGDLRDALSRNEVKLPDLAGLGDLLGGDPLLRANRELAKRAPGIYLRGEVYLRWLQRLSSLVFGTRPGRWFTLFVALPFGGAWASRIFGQELLHLVQEMFPRAEDLPTANPVAHPPHDLWPAPADIMIGIFYLLLLHLPGFRRLVGRNLRLVWHGMRGVLLDLPATILQLSPVRWLVESRAFRFLVHYILRPLPGAFLAWAILHGFGASSKTATVGGGAALLAVGLLLNSRLGRDLEEILTDWVVQRWDYLRGFLPGLVWLLIDFFKSILEAIDRFLYTVDEWFRFRQGQGRLTLAAKTVLGFLWFLVTYVIRLYVNVFIEPTFNPLKHFPAVTVAAKLLVALWFASPGLREFLAAALMLLGPELAYTVAFVNLNAMAGAAGFLVWELKENWRLYRANRAANLRPALIGHHGETMLRLMKPGFHSGTLPKLYAKMRRAERRALRGGARRPVRRLKEALHHVEDSIRHFTERDLLAFLGHSQGWRSGPVHLAKVRAGSNRIRLELACPELGEPNLEVKIEEQSGWLVAHISRPGWLPLLSPGEAAVLTLALTGFYKKAGVDLVREQIEACLGPECPPYDIADQGLVVWPGKGYETEVVYDLGAGAVLQPRVVEGRPNAALPTLAADQLFSSRRAVAWQDWVAAWERDQAGAGIAEPLVAGFRLLPIQHRPG